ncbi:hypothetical protein GHT06_003769 [Daphnia sinensis]|uniref:Uncharacterized protein n=1 Tax=Daphnia sinensis TaxID=1820382 RepID=A0AAD5PLF8_9CRUS|nr:hypothetical protein GHT06_003769 [Daphnia sinensis]
MLQREVELVKAQTAHLQLQRDMRADEDYLPLEYTKAAQRLRNTTRRVCSRQQPGIYVFVSKYGPVPFLKIGLSLKNVVNRMKEAATWHTDTQKRLLFALPVPEDKLREAEKFVHAALFQENIEREMFGVEFCKLAGVLAEMAERFMVEDARDFVLDVFAGTLT